MGAPIVPQFCAHIGRPSSSPEPFCTGRISRSGRMDICLGIVVTGTPSSAAAHRLFAPYPRRQKEPSRSGLRHGKGSYFMRAIAVTPADKKIGIIELPEPVISSPTDVKLRMIEAGAWGTDHEICPFE